MLQPKKENTINKVTISVTPEPWEGVFKNFHDDNEHGGSNRWRVSPNTVKQFIHGLLYGERLRHAKQRHHERFIYALFFAGLIAWLGVWMWLNFGGLGIKETPLQVVPSLESTTGQAVSAAPVPHTFLARVTEYGPTGRRMANGEYPHIGVVATSDRTIPFGTRILLNGREYVVKDRTARWVRDSFALPTIDVYSETPSGLMYTNIQIL